VAHVGEELRLGAVGALRLEGVGARGLGRLLELDGARRHPLLEGVALVLDLVVRRAEPRHHGVERLAEHADLGVGARLDVSVEVAGRDRVRDGDQVADRPHQPARQPHRDERADAARERRERRAAHPERPHALVDVRPAHAEAHVADRLARPGRHTGCEAVEELVGGPELGAHRRHEVEKRGAPARRRPRLHREPGHVAETRGRQRRGLELEGTGGERGAVAVEDRHERHLARGADALDELAERHGVTRVDRVRTVAGDQGREVAALLREPGSVLVVLGPRVVGGDRDRRADRERQRDGEEPGT
jgi:hypothetical protein